MLRESIGELAPHCNFLIQFLLAILIERSVSMPKLSLVLASDAKPESNRTRIRRFLDDHRIQPLAFAKIIASFLPQEPWILAIDRTNWFWGKTSFNLLVVAVVFEGVAIPLLWKTLPHGGNSHTDDRIGIISDFIAQFGAKKILYVTGDREFIGKSWLQWLRKNQIPFRIRLRRDDLVQTPRGEIKECKTLFRRTNPCKVGVFLLWGVPVYLGGKPLEGEEMLIIASSHPGNLLLDYRNRWKIECLFQALKGRGFDLECTRISQTHRLCLLLGVLTLAYLVCVRAGQGIVQETCKATNRLRKSVPRSGLDLMHRVALFFLPPPSEQQFNAFYRAFTPGKT